MSVPALRVVADRGALPEYPLGPSERLDSHHFMAWERRRWLNSDMRLKGDEAARALYFDLICISHDQTPVGTLPRDLAVLAKLLYVDRERFERMCALEYGPLHNWMPCLCGEEVRLMHPFVVEVVTEAMTRREDNRAKNEAANRAKRLQRLRKTLAGLSAELAENDHCVQFIDEWLVDQGVSYRGTRQVEAGLQAWMERMGRSRAG